MNYLTSTFDWAAVMFMKAGEVYTPDATQKAEIDNFPNASYLKDNIVTNTNGDYLIPHGRICGASYNNNNFGVIAGITLYRSTFF